MKILVIAAHPDDEVLMCGGTLLKHKNAGVIIASGVIITCNVSIGKHAQLNLNSTIGHDCIIDDYFTASPSVSISGSCIIKEQVYLGTGSLLREGIFITNNSIIGMGAVVVKKIKEKGTYIGNPARKLDK